MKALQVIVVLCITTNLSLYSMNIIPHKTHKLHAINKINLFNRHCSTDNLYNPSERPKLLKLNILAGIGGAVLACGSGCEDFLIPIIPHIFNSVCLFSYTIKNQPTQFEEDLQILIEKKPHIIKNIKETAQKIKYLKNSPQHLSPCDRLSLVEHQNSIIALEKNTTELVHNLIKEMLPVFKTHDVTEILYILRKYTQKSSCGDTYANFTAGLNCVIVPVTALSVGMTGSLPHAFIPFFILNLLLTLKTIPHIFDIADHPNNTYSQDIIELIEILKMYNNRNYQIQHHSTE